MSPNFLHHHAQFRDLIRIVAMDLPAQEGVPIDPALVEKDYWIMHCLYGLQQLNLKFELKGGTSLSKGYGIIDRFSDDIDIRIDPPEGQNVATGKNQNKPIHVDSRKSFYDGLAQGMKIDGIVSVERDPAFDDEKFRSGGIRLLHESVHQTLAGLKTGVLLEVGFDTVTPNQPKDISSWAYDYAASEVDIVDNRALDVPCYEPGYTLVEKLQTISTKFRQQQENGAFPPNFMRHYYDVYRLLKTAEVFDFTGTEKYYEHKNQRFRQGDNKNIPENEAFLLSDPETRKVYEEAYEKTSTLYYRKRPSLDDVLREIASYAERL